MSFEHSDGSSEDGQPIEAVGKPNDRDVLCGRGGLTNTHPGNAWYRKLVRENRSFYRSSPKHGKILVAKAIVNHVFAQNPPCRFLEKSKDGKWYSVNWKRSVDKTSQALRERDREFTSKEEDTAAIAAEMILLKTARQNRTSEMEMPQLILPPQPDYKHLEVKRQSDRSFSLIPDSIGNHREHPKKRKATAVLHRPVRTLPPSAAVLAAVNSARPIAPMPNPTSPAGMEAVVTQVSQRFWTNNLPKSRVKQRHSEPHARQRSLPSASLAKSPARLITAVSTASTTTLASPGVELLSYLRNSKSGAPPSATETAPFKLNIPASAPRHVGNSELTTRAISCEPTDSQDDQFADPDDDIDPAMCILPKTPNSIRRSSFGSKPLGSADLRLHAYIEEPPAAALTGALCRVCKVARFHDLDVPDSSTAAETHPELPWSTSKPKSCRAINVVLDHCLRAHAHWPLWNTLSSVQDSFPSPPRGVNVLHRALGVAANALPHKIGDSYASSDEFNFRVAHRIGLAEGYVKWGPWEYSDQRALQILAASMLHDYCTSLKMAISYNWEKISSLSHQDRVDLFNNIFLVPFCIDQLRENGELFPPVVPLRVIVPKVHALASATETMQMEAQVVQEKVLESSDCDGAAAEKEGDDEDSNAEHIDGDDDK